MYASKNSCIIMHLYFIHKLNISFSINRKKNKHTDSPEPVQNTKQFPENHGRTRERLGSTERRCWTTKRQDKSNLRDLAGSGDERKPFSSSSLITKLTEIIILEDNDDVDLLKLVNLMSEFFRQISSATKRSNIKIK